MQCAMLRTMILFLSIMTLTSACAIRGNGHGVAYVADGTIVVAGVALLAQREPEPNDPVDVLLDSESDSTDLFQPGGPTLAATVARPRARRSRRSASRPM